MYYFLNPLKFIPANNCSPILMYYRSKDIKLVQHYDLFCHPVQLPFSVTSHMPEYFDDPETFNPERFAKESARQVVINPWRMREGYGSRSVCVCVCVCYHASCYIPSLYNANKAPSSRYELCGFR